MGPLILDPHRLEPAGASHLSQAFGIMGIALVDPRRQHPLGMARADASDRDPALLQPVIEEGRQRPGLQDHPHKPRRSGLQCPGDHIGISGAGPGPHNLTRTVRHAHVGHLVGNIQPGVDFSHGPSSFVKQLQH